MGDCCDVSVLTCRATQIRSAPTWSFPTTATLRGCRWWFSNPVVKSTSSTFLSMSNTASKFSFDNHSATKSRIFCLFLDCQLPLPYASCNRHCLWRQTAAWSRRQRILIVFYGAVQSKVAWCTALTSPVIWKKTIERCTLGMMLVCSLVFSSWTYDGFQINLTKVGEDGDMSNYKPNSEWALIKLHAIRHVLYYRCLPHRLIIQFKCCF